MAVDHRQLGLVDLLVDVETPADEAQREAEDEIVASGGVPAGGMLCTTRAPALIIGLLGCPVELIHPLRAK